MTQMKNKLHQVTYGKNIHVKTYKNKTYYNEETIKDSSLEILT